MFEKRKLNEEEENKICECESCKYKPLKHFEKCPVCYSEAFHNGIKEIKN